MLPAGTALMLASAATQQRKYVHRCDAGEPLRFGIIADIQYADVDDAENFAKTETRSRPARRIRVFV